MASEKHLVPLFCCILCFTLTNFVLNFRFVISEKPVIACDVSSNPGLKNFSFCNASLDVKTRVDDLSEALHGVSNTGGLDRPITKFSRLVPGATSFPQVILTSATFNVSLFELIGKVVSTEARAMYNVGLAGLTFWSPNVNIFRDPRWGRGQETPGEDPMHSSKYGAAYVRGLQQRDDGDKDRLKVGACCKHYTAYDIDNWKGINRYTFNAVVKQQDLDDTFQPPFKSCVIDGNVASVMCSYNQVNGKPTCGDPDLLAGVIRDQWQLNGYISSDCDSLDKMFNSQKYTKTPGETAALAIKSGLDLNCGSFLGDHTQAAIDRGLLNETDINKAISNNFATLMRLGFFDGDPSKQLYGNLGPKDVCTPENQEFAREVARQGIVLLKNTEGSLPFSPTAIKSLAVIGPNANATRTMIGNYEGITYHGYLAGLPCKYTTPLQGLTASVATVYQPGCANVLCTTAQVDEANKVAAAADAVVLIMGSDQSIEAESKDRLDITLPGQQSILVTAVANVSKGPVILVIMSGGGMDIQFAKDDPKITSILWVGFPGEAGGAAIADVIFGFYNPSGRLPMTWYPQSYVDKVPMTNMNMRPDPATGYPGRTYRFYTGPTVFLFGEGLSYSKFNHYLVRAPKLVSIPLDEGQVCHSSKCTSIDAVEETCKNIAFNIHLRVKNMGEMAGSHTVFLFSSPPQVHNAPQKHLLGFEKIHLTPMAEGLVRFNVDVCKHLSLVDELGTRKVALGQHVLHVGSLKHYLNRYTFNAVVTQQDLDDTFQPPFKSCVIDGNVAGVMCSYNQVNGKPTCGDPVLLAGVIRGQWQLNGYISSDCDSLKEMFYSQNYTKTPEETAALAIKFRRVICDLNWLDLNCGSFLSDHTQAATDRGLLNETNVNKAISNNFATLMRLGFFDGDPSKQLYGNLGPKDVCTTANQEFAREVARQGTVLLKNTEGSLPLSPTAIKSLAVIGPNDNVTKTMIGNYEGFPLDEAKKVAAAADAVVLIMGSDQSIEAESKYRLDITLPGQQSILVTAVTNVSKSVILVIMSGGGMDIQFAKDDPKITSILWVGFPGEAGGAAITDVIFGYYNSSGRIPLTWYPQSYVDKVPMTNMNMRPDPTTGYPGGTYRFYTGPTVFSFGDGLSYSQFNHHLVQAPKLISVPLDEGHVCHSSNCKSISAVEETCKNIAFNIHLRVKKVGKMAGNHTVFLCSSPPQVHNAPRKHLLGFEKVHLTPMAEGLVRFNVDVCKNLSMVDERGNRKVALGQHVLHVGSLKHYLSVRI
ncbi:unnamed protein product [Fraxinus pennsylvanica]|uniref:Fibronectin type III-like domain-containing protein n=1 Tax=Fraxinus pennsylvanica TaxID=56036 RepID=A0AAD2DT83_9LAMI|nr:unnamed protein product [Fraxinus pennsylvanica]